MFGHWSFIGAPVFVNGRAIKSAFAIGFLNAASKICAPNQGLLSECREDSSGQTVNFLKKDFDKQIRTLSGDDLK